MQDGLGLHKSTKDVGIVGKHQKVSVAGCQTPSFTADMQPDGGDGQLKREARSIE